MIAESILDRPEQLLSACNCSPSVVITLPFDPKMTPKGQLNAALTEAATKAERQLMARYPRKIALPVIHQLQKTFSMINFFTHKKSLALFVSPETENLMYLDETIDTQVLVDSDFSIRDLTIASQANIQYLVLLLSGSLSKMYHGDGSRLTLIKNNGLKATYAFEKELPEKTGKFSDTVAHKQALLDEFLKLMDEGLSTILNAYPLPVFVFASNKVFGHFARITRNDRHIAAYINKNCIGAKAQELKGALQPWLGDWRKVRQQMALKYIDLALETGKLVTGIEEVGKATRTRNSRLLIVERGFTEASGFQSPGEFYIHDLVDGIVKKVLENGGQVEWVDEGQLEAMDHIALVRFN
jgi:hypothetical protein